MNKPQRLTEQERQEFASLKRTLCKYGFLTSPEKMRYNELWDKNLAYVSYGLKLHEDIAKQIDQN
jgi:hypothetical protein